MIFMLPYTTNSSQLDVAIPDAEMAARIAFLSQALGAQSLMVAEECDDSLTDGLLTQDEEELRICNMVKEALDGGPGKTYATVADFIAELRANIPQTQA
jgi:hypothetical protein